MQEIITDPLRGKISVRARFHGGFGIVELHKPYEGIKYAVLNGETVGRIALMNLTKDGGLPLDKEVIITKARKGSQAFLALEVAAA